jgi:hypothetical protein
LGGTYFAIYHTNTVTQLIQSTNIDFERLWWPEIPEQYQHRLIQMGLQKEKYDTGKLLNLLLLDKGKALIFKESSSLHHIGGLSAYNTFDMSHPWVRHLKDLIVQHPEKKRSQRSTQFSQIYDLASLGIAITDDEWMRFM